MPAHEEAGWKNKGKTMKKTDIWKWTTIILLVAGGINALIKVANPYYVGLDTILGIAGFFGIMVILYGYNGFRFNNLLNLILFGVAMVILGWGFTVIGAPTSIGFIGNIVNGLKTLMQGTAIGGFIAFFISLLMLKKTKKR